MHTYLCNILTNIILSMFIPIGSTPQKYKLFYNPKTLSNKY